MTPDASTTVNSLILDLLAISISLGSAPEDPAPHGRADEWASFAGPAVMDITSKSNPFAPSPTWREHRRC
jgi:hypothetical protein